MKKALIIIIAVFIVLVLATPVFAAKPDKSDKVTGQDRASVTESTNQSKADKEHPKGAPPGQDKKEEVGGVNPHGEPPGQVDKEHPKGAPPGQDKKEEVGGGNPHGEPPGQVDREHPKGAPPGQGKKEPEPDPDFSWTGTWILWFGGGTMTLTQVDNEVTGTYFYTGYDIYYFSGEIYGTVEDSIFSGTLDEEWQFNEYDGLQFDYGYFDDWIISSDGSSFEGSVTWDDGGSYPWWGTRE